MSDCRQIHEHLSNFSLQASTHLCIPFNDIVLKLVTASCKAHNMVDASATYNKISSK